MTKDDVESQRLQAVARYQMADAPSGALDNLASLAADVFNAPVAAVVLVDRDRVWCKGCHGMEGARIDLALGPTPKTILKDRPWIVDNATASVETRDYPWVAGDFGLRFYAGVPLRSPDGFNLGTLCVMDFKPRSVSDRQVSRLERLAAGVVEALELRRSAHEAAASLKLTEERLRDWTETSSDFRWETDEFNYFTAYDGRGENVGRPYDFNKNELTATAWAETRECHRSRRAFRNLELAVNGENGAVNWIKVSGRPFFDDAGRFKGYRGVMSRINAEKRTEQELQRRAKQQQGLAVLSQIALQEMTTENLFQFACDTIRRTLQVDYAGLFLPNAEEGSLVLRGGSGFPQGDIGRREIVNLEGTVTGRAFGMIDPLTVFDMQAAQCTWNESTSSVPMTSCMAVGIGDLSARFGVVMAGCIGARAFSPEDENFLQAVAFVLRAVLERKQVLSQLRLTERALEAVGHGIVIADATHVDLPIIYVNAAVEAATQYERDELFGKPSGFLFHGRNAVDSASSIAAARERHGQISKRIEGKRRDGSTFPVEVVTSQVLNETATVTHILWVYADITHRLKLEADLRQAQKMEAIGKLTAGVAHDFNNLLTVILGNAEVIGDMTLDPEMKPMSEMIIQAAERGADTVQRLLAFGRRQALQPETFDVNGALESLVGMFHKLLGEEVALKSNLPTDKYYVHADKSQLETAILNLVVNARDAMPRGGIVSIETTMLELDLTHANAALLPGAYVSIRVSDTGCGMSSDVVERAFEPFFTTKEVGKGTGLGLSMVYGFVQQSGGLARIESKVGVGTTIEILLPETVPLPVETTAEVILTPARGRERVLVVEDQEDVRLFVTSQLRSLGYDVTSVADGPTALAHLRTSADIQLLFSDILLPGGIDGIEVAEEASRLRPELKILFTSGYSDKAVERSNRFLDGSARLLKKPYRRAELAQALREAIESTS
jgi:PAS domain S-box-containing protein